MTEHVASRTLVKSPPELWAECSDAASLARHLGRFGDIEITRLEPETAVAWEGERARGTVRIEPSGWGTKVILTAVAAEQEVAPAAVEVAQPVVEVVDAPDELEEPEEPEEPDTATAPPRRRRLPRLFRFRREPAPAEPTIEPEQPAAPEPVVQAQPVPVPESEPESEAEAGEAPTPEPTATETTAETTEAALAAALDSLGQAHHRPYSRA